MLQTRKPAFQRYQIIWGPRRLRIVIIFFVDLCHFITLYQNFHQIGGIYPSFKGIFQENEGTKTLKAV